MSGRIFLCFLFTWFWFLFGATVSRLDGRQIEAESSFERIRIASDGLSLVTKSDHPFVPLGVTYFRPGTGWAPQLWKQWDAAKTRIDLKRLKSLGANTVRVFITFGSFAMERGILDETGLNKFEEFLALAEEQGLRVQPTGLDAWEGVPDWMNHEGGRGDQADRFADEENLKFQENFWRKFAGRFKGRTSILAYELLNEPSVPWTSPAMLGKWREWCQTRYVTIGRLLSEWGLPGNAFDSFATIETPAAEARLYSRQLLDYQHFRESIATEWTRRQVAAIKSVDPDALVTIGLVQWSVPIKLFTVAQYSGFRPIEQARSLDFLELHFYPWDGGFYEYEGPKTERRNLAYLQAMLHETRKAGKPVVIGEFGWYGGGKLAADGGKHPFASEEQQARWGRAVMEQSVGHAAGWLTWALYDYPEAQDPTEFSGLLRADGAPKLWGHTFAQLAARLRHRRPEALPFTHALELDWAAALTDPVAGDRFRDACVQAFQSMRSR